MASYESLNLKFHRYTLSHMLFWMTEITFQLIRKSNPELSIDDIEGFTCINLNNCNIECIDNLELFEHIKELHLSHNLITKIDNLAVFQNLELLDVSFNKIDSHGLLSSFDEIPQSLHVINLTGNPCLHDEGLLIKLQDYFPHLGIVIDESDDADDGDKNEDGDDGFDIDYLPSQSTNNESFCIQPLSSDEVLKSIVDRKSKLQSYERFNLDKTVSVWHIYVL